MSFRRNRVQARKNFTVSERPLLADKTKKTKTAQSMQLSFWSWRLKSKDSVELVSGKTGRTIKNKNMDQASKIFAARKTSGAGRRNLHKNIARRSPRSVGIFLRRRSGRQSCASARELLDLDLGASRFDLFLDLFGLFLGDALFERLRSTLDECFRFGETEPGD